MIAISIPKQTIYDSNLYQLGPNMIAMSKIVLWSRDYDFWTNLVEMNCRLLQSYLVPFEWDCNHIWSVSEQRLQSYLVLIVILFAIIYGPAL